MIRDVYRERFKGVSTDSQAINLFMEFKAQVESAGLYTEKTEGKGFEAGVRKPVSADVLDSFGFIEVIQSLKSDNEKLLERVKVLEEREESFSNRIGSSDHFRYLELRLSKLEELVKDYPFGSQNVSTASDPISELECQKGQINLLDARITLLDSRLGEQPVEMGEHRFKSVLDVEIFVRNHIESRSYECFYDFVSLMDSIRDTNSDVNTFATAEYNAQRTKYVSQDEVSISNSFTRLTPGPFTKSKSLTETYKSIDLCLSKIKKRENWTSSGGLSGIKRMIESEMKNRKVAVSRQIVRTLKSSKGADLAREFLHKSYTCFTEFFNWTENFYSELTSISNISDEQAWELILRAWMTFFIDLRKIRSECASLSGGGMELHSEKRIKVVAQYIWTMGKAIMLQEEYLDKSFRDHPSISTVINYFLFENMTTYSIFNEQMKTVQEDLSALKTWKGQATRTMSNLQNKK